MTNQIPIIKVKPLKGTKKEKRLVKIMEKWINYEYESNRDFINTVIMAQTFVDKMFAIDTPSSIWERIMVAGLKLKMEAILRMDKKDGKNE
jgi:hypothetical protein